MTDRRFARAWKTLGWAVAALAVAGAAQAIVVAPHHVFIDHRTRSGVLYLFNPGDRPEEVTVELVFGYPVSDSAGNVSVQLIEDPSPEEPSAAGWMRAFPRRARVAPGQRQAVRLLAQPPLSLADGEYWTRVVVASRPTEPPVTAADTGVRVGLTLEVRTVIPVTYRKGAVSTGVDVTGLQTAVEGDSVVVRVGMRRLGSAAYLGTMRLALRDTLGVARAEWDQHVAVYHDLLRRASLPVAGLPPGTYNLHLRIDTERSDLEARNVLSAQPLEAIWGVRLP
jgi:P pilus assembly chaperone PapD